MLLSIMNFTFHILLVSACASPLQNSLCPLRNIFPQGYASYSCLRSLASLNRIYDTVGLEEMPAPLRTRKQLIPETVTVVSLLAILLLFQSGADSVPSSVNMRVDECFQYAMTVTAMPSMLRSV